MAIVQTVDVHSFRDAFAHANRKENFSYEGLEILFDYLEELSEETGETIDLDVIGLCCEYEEMAYDEVIETYLDLSDDEMEEINDDDSEKREKVVQWLYEQTTVCGYDDEIVVFRSF